MPTKMGARTPNSSDGWFKNAIGLAGARAFARGRLTNKERDLRRRCKRPALAGLGWESPMVRYHLMSPTHTAAAESGWAGCQCGLPTLDILFDALCKAGRTYIYSRFGARSHLQFLFFLNP